MSKKINMYLEENNNRRIPRIKFEGALEALSLFFDSDLNSVNLCNELLKKMALIINKESLGFKERANVSYISVSEKEVMIENIIFLNIKTTIDFLCFKKIIESWRVFLMDNQ